MRGNTKSNANLILGITSLFLICFIVSAYAVVTSTPSGDFNVTTSPSDLTLNWTNDYKFNISIWSNLTNKTEVIVLANSSMSSNYSQKELFSSTFAWSSGVPGCFDSNASLDIPFASVNASNTSQYLDSMNISNDTSENWNITLFKNVSCPPGRYYGNITVINYSNSSEHANITVTMDIPINESSGFNTTTGKGLFGGIMRANSSMNHSYYFNTSIFSNLKAVTIKINWSNSSNDVDLFLINQTSSDGTLLGKSIGKDGRTESINYTNLPVNETWEIRVYGNLTSNETYTGYFLVTTLNRTLTLDDKGDVYPNWNQSNNITINNTGALNLSSIAISHEVYHETVFKGTGNSNFTFVVPSGVTKLRIGVNWTNSSNNYTIKLYDPNNSLIINSSEGYRNAYLAAVQMEEYVNTTNITSGGFWTLQVTNNTSSSVCAYNATVKMYVNESAWFSTNYSTASLNQSGLANDTMIYTENFTVPNTSMAGLYKGVTRYADSRGAVLERNFQANVSAAILLINGSLGNATYTDKENIGYNRSTSNPFRMSITMNNSGNIDLAIIANSSSTNLTSGSSYMNFTYNFTNVSANSSGYIYVNASFTQNSTNNFTAGTYTGWIFFNASNNTFPNETFNLTVRVNLTNDLVVNVTDVVSEDGDHYKNNRTASENVTVYFKVYYQNDTELTDTSIFTFNNTSAWLYEANSSYRYPTSGYLAKWEPSSFYGASAYTYNVTIPGNLPGGYYHMYVKVNDTRNNFTFDGEGGRQLIYINNTGLNQTESLGSSTIYDDNITYFNVSVTNYGPVDATGTLTIGDCAHLTEEAFYGFNSSGVDSSNCYSSRSGRAFTIALSGNGSETCVYQYKLTGTNVDSNQTCSLNITATDATFNTISGTTLTISDSPAASSSSSTNTGTSGSSCSSDANCASAYHCVNNVCVALNCASNEKIENHQCVAQVKSLNVSDYTSPVYVTLGSSNSTTVKTQITGDMVLAMGLNVTVPTGITASISPSSCSGVDNDSKCTFNVTFNATSSASLGDNTGTYTAYFVAYPDTIDNQSFVVNVLSTAEREVEVNETYDNYSARYQSLLNEFNSLFGVPEDNKTVIESLLNESNNTLYDAKAALDSGDYATAEGLLSDLNVTLTRIEDELQSLREAGIASLFGDLWIWVAVVVVIVAIVGFVVYLFMPPSKPSLKKSFKPKTDHMKAVREVPDKVKKMFKREKKDKPFSYKYKG